MISRFLSLLLLVIFALPSISAYPQNQKVSENLWRNVRSNGTIRVLVLLNLRQDSLLQLKKEDQVVAAQNMLLAELSGTNYHVTGRFRYVTGLGLIVDSAGLAIIERSANVDKVEEDLPNYPN